MDPSARKINTARFSLNQVSVLIVTDVAARGIDIPSLDYVINVHFPGKPKLFVHRVGENDHMHIRFEESKVNFFFKFYIE